MTVYLYNLNPVPVMTFDLQDIEWNHNEIILNYNMIVLHFAGPLCDILALLVWHFGPACVTFWPSRA